MYAGHYGFLDNCELDLKIDGLAIVNDFDFRLTCRMCVDWQAVRIPARQMCIKPHSPYCGYTHRDSKKNHC